MWNEFISDPQLYNERLLAERYGMSIARVRAILRLKGLEEYWQKEGKPIQTGFQLGMEEILGVNEEKARITDVVFRRGQAELGEDTTGADLDADSVDRARERYQRLFWEPVVEGKDPITPGVIEKARADVQAAKRAARAAKIEHVLPSRDQASPTQVIVQQPMRSYAVKFVDVRGKFVDSDDILHRRKEAQRRKAVKRRRREKIVERIAQSASDS
ncbi:hypothetical protein OBBRIDRAFT_787888 [Obba rivulosa]|uniref:Uncharacterized protein n=1 Tax=Obba rivulosa TaxID=1052685 RepID=A0A8E2DTT0_9APHY|nr:hypothetical protein OBBRIDRAFT_787888 [Obba rivulosa]